MEHHIKIAQYDIIYLLCHRNKFIIKISFKYNDLAELANTFIIKIDSKQQQP